MEPDQLAAAKADTITRPELITRLRDRLGLAVSADELSTRFTVSVEATSNLVVIRAVAPTAGEAAKLANGLADTSVSVEGQDARRRYRAAALGVSRRLARASASKEDGTARLQLQDQLIRLESLAALAQPAAVAKSAQVPDTPSSPKPVRNSIIAGFLGMLLGFGVAWSRETLDRRVRAPADIVDGLGLPVLASVKHDVMGRVAHLESDHGGARGAMESFRVLRTSLTLLAPQPRVVAVTSALPDEGKSTVAASLACAYGASGLNTLLIECDSRRPSLAARLGSQLPLASLTTSHAKPP